jgi:hypothetical protein
MKRNVENRAHRKDPINIGSLLPLPLRQLWSQELKAHSRAGTVSTSMGLLST